MCLCAAASGPVWLRALYVDPLTPPLSAQDGLRYGYLDGLPSTSTLQA